MYESKWRHICLLATDINVVIAEQSVDIFVPRELLVQGCRAVQQEVLIADKFQGAYTCIPVVDVVPEFGTLIFLGSGWQYTKGLQFGLSDSFTYRMYARVLDLYSPPATVDIIQWE